jgi:hypothetical protein
MAKDRRDVLALHIAHDPALALDLAIFSLARPCRAFRLFRYRLHHPHHRPQRAFGPDRHSGESRGDRTRTAARQPAQ